MKANALEHKKYSADPVTWGPHVWSTIHTVAKKADFDDCRHHFYALLDALEYLLPCETCRLDYCAQRRLLQGHEKRISAFEYSVMLHNAVNKKLGKPLLSLEAAVHLWNDPSCSYVCSTTNTDDTNSISGLMWPVLLGFLVCGAAIFAFYKHHDKAVSSR